MRAQRFFWEHLCQTLCTQIPPIGSPDRPWLRCSPSSKEETQSLGCDFSGTKPHSGCWINAVGGDQTGLLSQRGAVTHSRWHSKRGGPDKRTIGIVGPLWDPGTETCRISGLPNYDSINPSLELPPCLSILSLCPGEPHLHLGSQAPSQTPDPTFSKLSHFTHPETPVHKS